MSWLSNKIGIARILLGLVAGIPLWFTIEMLTPSLTKAYTARVDLGINTLVGENYNTILRRAEAVARAAVQRNFDRDILVTDVSVIISVQHQGAIAPILELDVSRPRWRNNPDPQRWAKYFKAAKALLYFQGNLSSVDNSKFVENEPQTIEDGKQKTGIIDN
ncbi:hypothetical protein [Mastigocoleus sp. MO_188.B34]|uniref:hypothetical protein n=1 Tax=Mastigocoleus sp. MO_188.B34 TaxID=3036635 RepID=UPI00261C1B8C|nr:hypothetical protein [Mastigocoleus sp. MO_188.B34]MDJ0696609.1 hypothetical protein [Mastigocoleus sp. MO_188.B34]